MKTSLYFAAALGISAIAPVTQAQSIDKPTFKEGDFWEYQAYDTWSNRMNSTFSKQVVGVSGDFVRMSFDLRDISKTGEVSRPQTSEATVRADMNVTSLSGTEKYEKIYYKWPLEVGKKWVSQYKGDLSPTGAGTAAVPHVITTTLDIEVKGWEKITTPAGQFNTLKIITLGSWSTSNTTPAIGNGTFTSTRWYSPEAKTDVQYVYDAFGADGTPLTKTKQVLSSYNLK